MRKTGAVFYWLPGKTVECAIIRRGLFITSGSFRASAVAAPQQQTPPKRALAKTPRTRSLRRAPEEPDASCWLAGDGWWLSNAPVSESSLAGSRDGQRPLKEI